MWELGRADVRHAAGRGALRAAMSGSRVCVALALVGVALGSTSCTLGKPLVCAVTTPCYVIGHSSGGCGDPRGLACAAMLFGAAGAAAGLVTGIVSDVNWMLGRATDPCRNLHDPFATNTSEPVLR